MFMQQDVLCVLLNKRDPPDSVIVDGLTARQYALKWVLDPSAWPVWRYCEIVSA